jgi:O-antigen ligase
MANSAPQRNRPFLMLTTSVYFIVGALLVLGQLVPGVTHQIAEGELLPQTLLWLLAATLLASEETLVSFNRNSSHQSNSSTKTALANGSHSSLDSKRSRWLPVVLGLIALVWIALSTRNVLGNGNMRHAMNTAWHWTGLLAAVFVLYRLMKSWRVSRIVFAILIALAWLSVVDGWYQVNVSLPADRASFKSNPEALLRQYGINAAKGTAEYMQFESRLNDDTPLGPFALTNSLAGFITPWFVFAIGLGFRRDFWKSTPWRASLGFLVLLTLLWCIAATDSRAAWIAIVVGFFAIVIGKTCSQTAMRAKLVRSIQRSFKNQPILPWVITTLIVFAIIIYAFGNLRLDSFFSEAWKSLAFRGDYWQATSKIIGERPLLGVGPGNFQTYYAAYKPIFAPEVVSDPHNFVLETMATVGLPLGIVLLVLIVWLTWSVFDFLASPSNEHEETNLVEATRLVESRSHIKSTLAIYAGAIAGAFALWRGGNALGVPPDLWPFAIGFPVVIFVLVVDYFLSISTTPNRMEPKGLVVAMYAAFISMLVHLSASSGWLTPGIMNSLIVLGCGIVSVMERANSKSDKHSQAHPVSWAPVSMIGTWLALGFFYWTVWIPFQSNKRLEARAFRDGLSEVIASEMIAADKYNPRGFAFLVATYVVQAEQELSRSGGISEATFLRYDAAVKKFLSLDTASEGAWTQAGQWEIRLSGNRPAGLKKALGYFQNASKRDPGDTGLLTQVALLAWLCEDTKTTGEYLRQAEGIDSQTPHRDKKLDARTVYLPPTIVPSSNRVQPSVWQKVRQTEGLSAEWVRANEVISFLRSQVGNSNGLLR